MAGLRVGVVGVGHLGRHHARILGSMPDVTLTGVVDANLEQARTIAEPLNTPAFDHFQAILNRVDAVSVAVPTRFHHAVAREFLSRGIPTLVEKPLASTIAEAEELVALAHQHDTILHVGHIERYNPTFGILHDAGVTPRYIAAERLGTYTFRSTDIGVVHDLMIHDIDLVLSLVNAPVSTVSAVGVSVFGATEDVASARIGFEDGTVADLSASRASLHATRKMRLWGPQGYVGLDFKTRQGLVVRPSKRLVDSGATLDGVDLTQPDALRNHVFGALLETENHTREGGEPLAIELGDFIQAIRSKGKPRVTGDDALKALRVAELVCQAIRDHEWNGHPAVERAHGEHAIPAPHVLRLDRTRSDLGAALERR